MTWRNAGTLLAVSLVVVLTVFILPDAVTAGEQLALFGFISAPFKLLGKGVKAVAKVAGKGVKFVARNAPVIAATLVGGPVGFAGSQLLLGGGGGDDFRGDLASPGFVTSTATAPASSRFSLAKTFEQFLQVARGEAQKLVDRASSQVTVKPRLSGAAPVILAIAGTVGVVGLIAGSIALARK